MTAPPDQIRKEITSNATASPSGSVIELGRAGEVGGRRKHTGTCPVCGHYNLDVTRVSGEWMVGCWSCEAEGLIKGAYLKAVAEVVGCGAWQVKQDPLTHLAGYVDQPGPSSAAPREPITEERVHEYVACLWDERGVIALAWLRSRGLTDHTISEYLLGYDDDLFGDSIVIPVYEDGEPVRIKRRFLDGREPKTDNSPGPAKLYPDVPKRKPLLVAGELDALIGRQVGLPTVSTTCGAKLPEHLASAFAGRRVFVMYDVGEDTALTVERLRAVGADVTVIDLAELGLPAKGDLNDLFLAGGTANDVKALCRRERGVA